MYLCVHIYIHITQQTSASRVGASHTCRMSPVTSPFCLWTMIVKTSGMSNETRPMLLGDTSNRSTWYTSPSKVGSMSSSSWFVHSFKINRGCTVRIILAQVSNLLAWGPFFPRPLSGPALFSTHTGQATSTSVLVRGHNPSG